jgi:hypothetical protein
MTQPTPDSAGNVQTTVNAVLRRDRRRIRTLSFLTIALWVLTGLLIPSLWMPMAAKIVKEAAVLLPDASPTPVTARQVADVVIHIAKVGMMASALMLIVALVAEIMAAVLTVMLVIAIRRVTLRQVSEQLAQISRQLDQLRGK